MADNSSTLERKEQSRDQNPSIAQTKVTPQNKSNRGNKTLLIVIILLLVTLICCISSIFLYSVLKNREEGTSIIESIKNLFGLEQEETSTDEEGDDEDESDETTDGGETSTTSLSCIATGFDREEYAHGASYTTLDDCQTCTCNDGDWECTVEERCIAPAADCLFEGESYNIGDEVLSEDGCTLWVCEGVGYMAGYHDDTCCIRLGAYYQNGETISEPCQDCVCNAGTWDCGVLDPTCCEYAYVIYESGDTFPHEDGCNTCMCTNGTISCTLMYCP
jgi:hypothetical protein